MKLDNLLNKFLANIVPLLCLTLSMVQTSCDKFDEHLPECEHGVRLRFTYTWNMEFANAFPAKVDCLTLLVYNDKGEYVTSYTETSAVLADENYRMIVDLPDGDYHLVAYGGMECSNSSFRYVTPPVEGTSLGSLQVALLPQLLTQPVGTNLHPLFYGALDTTITSVENEYTEATIDMMRDTNNLRVMLQHLDGSPINDQDFVFTITDRNTLMDGDNTVLDVPEVVYAPWTQGTLATGIRPNDEEDVLMAYAELSFCRLVTSNSPRLIITAVHDGHKVVDIPLNNYLLASKSEQYARMPAQEYLDRQHDWNMTFFLDSYWRWAYVEIKVLDWVVRLNHFEL